MSFEPYANPVITIELEQPIQYLGEKIEKLAIREPVAGDIFRCGNPVKKFNVEDGSVEFDEQKAFAMLSRLTKVAIEGSLEQMTPNDAVNAFWGIARFFIPGFRTRPAPASKKPDELPAS